MTRNHGVLGAGVGPEVRTDASGPARARIDLVLQAVGEVVGGQPGLLVEVVADALDGEGADDDREAHRITSVRHRRAAGQAPADRNAPIRGVRSLRRGSYGGGEARHLLRAFLLRLETKTSMVLVWENGS
jgi:hypothetical protein